VGRLREIGDRRRAILRLRSALWLMALAPAGVVAVGWLDLLAGLPPGLRVAGTAAALLAAAGFVVRAAARARQRSRPTAVARDVDKLARADGQVAVGLSLTQPRRGWPALTVALARMAVVRALGIAAGVPEGRIEPLRTASPAFRCFLAVVAGTAALAVLWPRAFQTELVRLADPWGDHPPYSRYAFRVKPGDARLAYGASVTVEAEVDGAPVEGLDVVVRQPHGAEEAMPMFEERDGSWRGQLTDVTSPLDYWVRAGRARSRRFRVSVIYTPRIEALSVRVTPPAYTNRPPVEGPLPQGGIAGLPGSTVQVSVQSNRPLSRGELRLTPSAGEPLAVVATPEAAAPKAVTLQFTVEKPGTMSLWVVDVAGERSAADVSAPILVLEDKKPFVRIVQPMAESFATPDVVLPVSVEAEDDYGVSALRVYRSLNGSRHLPEALMVPIPAEARVQGGDVLLLPQYALSPGDTIALFARAEDTDPAGPKGSESGLVRITIISRETYEELLCAQERAADFEAKYEAAARRLESLQAEGDRLSEGAAKEQGEAVSQEMRQRLDALAENLKQAARETRATAEREPLYALDKELADSLRELAAALDEAGAEAGKAARAASPEEMRQALQSARQSLGAGREQYSQSVQQPLEDFMRAYSLLEMQERFVSLYERQKDLGERMADLQGRDGEDDPALRVRMRDLKEEQDALRGELTAVLDGIRARSAQLSDDPRFAELRQTAGEFAEAVAQSRAAGAMQDSANGLADNKGTAAHAGAAEAADVLEGFVEKCRASAGASAEQCRLAFQPRMQESAAMTAAQLLQAANLGTARGTGSGMGMGAGQGGYSMRSNTLENVGVYGPPTMNLAGGGGRESSYAALVRETPGGTMAGEIAGGPPGAPGSEGVPLQSVPPQHRRGVQDYFRRVADEAASGRITDPAGGGLRSSSEERK